MEKTAKNREKSDKNSENNQTKIGKDTFSMRSSPPKQLPNSGKYLWLKVYKFFDSNNPLSKIDEPVLLRSF